jgi:hypothetical protein
MCQKPAPFMRGSSPRQQLAANNFHVSVDTVTWMVDSVSELWCVDRTEPLLFGLYTGRRR